MTTTRCAACRRLGLAGLVWLDFSGPALSNDSDDGDGASAKPASTLPNIYLDLRTNYATVPANTLSIGFSNPSLSSAIATLQTLSTLTNFPTPRLPGVPTPSSPSRQCFGFAFPLTVDLNDRVSASAGCHAHASQH